MATPPSTTLQNLSGTYLMNKKLSDDPDALLAQTRNQKLPNTIYLLIANPQTPKYLTPNS